MSEASEARKPLDTNSGLWRYMDLGRFLALIDRKELYFSRLHEFEDTWEGAWSPTDPLFAGHDPEYMNLEATNFASLPLVSCWHENEAESVAMWKLYVNGREGVAIKTTVSSLIDLFSSGRELKLGRVGYRDINDMQHLPEVFTFEDGRCTGNSNLLPVERTVFRKNRGYEHEQEVRLLIYDRYCASQAIFNGEQLNDLQSLALGLKPKLPSGVGVPLDLTVLIHRIVVSPAFPIWAIPALQKAVDSVFFSSQPLRIETSALLDKPAIGKQQVRPSDGPY